MARPVLEIVAEAKRKIDKERMKFGYQSVPFNDAKLASNLCDPCKYGGNNKSEWIKKLATAVAYILCEIETIQRKKGDGII